MKTTYEIRWTDGRTETADSYLEAIEIVEREYPDAVTEHDGDLSDGGDRTLCWADDASSANDGGAKAVAAIY